ncbi:replication stress response regulator SDE2-like [Salvia divinorum]|uniref:Replication stress response regulator SDE2-like n=1 Tax=Salvia divinorum TaxID=28513 RepID=A0ABD1HZK5_SALDI
MRFGKRKLGESDSEEDEDNTSVEEEKNEGSVVIENGSHSDSSKGVVGASSGSVDGGELGAGSIEQDGCVGDGNSKHRDTPVIVIESPDGSKDNDVVISPSKSHPSEVHEVVSQHPGTSVSEVEVVSAAETRTVSLENVEKPLNFDDYHSPSEMEVLGLERLKSELQARGLKCGGTLTERAGRLFLLKTTPLEMLPKKLFAKK